jgi:hypothetical protein
MFTRAFIRMVLKKYIMIQVYKEAFKAPATNLRTRYRSAFNVASPLKTLIHVYYTLFFY